MRMRIALLGCGNVGRALLTLLASKAERLRAEEGLEVVVTGGRTRSAGGWLAPEGIAPAALAKSGWPEGPLSAGAQSFEGDGVAYARAAPADVLVELTTLDPRTGQPALDHVRAALESGKSVVTANKGPIAHAYRDLRGLAESRGLGLRFESTVMDGTPIFGMVAATLPVTDIQSFRGVLNSTSNFILAQMEKGKTVEEGIAAAQAAGIAEADPRYDLDGWDASVKVIVLANVLMGADLRPEDINREGLGADAMRARFGLRPNGTVVKQVAIAERAVDGSVRATVRLETLSAHDTLGSLAEGETAVRLVTDTMGELTLIEGDGGPWQTAFGVLADLVTIARGKR